MLVNTTANRIFAVLFCIAFTLWSYFWIFYSSSRAWSLTDVFKKSVFDGPSSVEETEYLEKISELYYQAQKVERFAVVHYDFLRVRSNYPCIYGVYPIGDDSEGSVFDGHKFACGVKAINGPPIVYSFGSHLQFDFEMAILKLRPDAIIFTFEISKSQIAKVQPHPSITVLPIGLGGYDKMFSVPNANMMTMRQIMKKLGHTYVDILKMDVEGFEVPFVHYESDLLRHVGQYLVEFHDIKGFEQSHKPGPINNISSAYPMFTYINFTEIVENVDLRIFHQEVNRFRPQIGIEASLIQKEWLSWDRNKRSLKI